MTRLSCRVSESLDGREGFSVIREEVRRATRSKSLLTKPKRWEWSWHDTLFAIFTSFILGGIFGLAFQPYAIRLLEGLDRVLP